MQDFLFLFRMDAKVMTMNLSPDDLKAIIGAWQQWIGELAAGGNFVSTQQLLPVGKVVSGANKGITDGPFTEAGELIGGDMVIKATDLDAAVELAKGCPVLYSGGRVEVRAIMPPQGL
ncbi:MAG: YciI family protein [Bacteroidia bacterium]|nr:YciI family protein [Bacteroidia bacterium]